MSTTEEPDSTSAHPGTPGSSSEPHNPSGTEPPEPPSLAGARAEAVSAEDLGSPAPRHAHAPEADAAPAQSEPAGAPSPAEAPPPRVSPFDSSVYRGVADSVRQNSQRALENDKKRAKSLGVFVTAALVVGGLLGGTAGGAFAIWNLSSRGLVTPGVTSPATITVNSPLQASEITAVAAAAMPSVVTIEVANQRNSGSGSGVIISPEGHVMTTPHVVSLGAEEPAIRVTMADGRLFSAVVVGRDVLSDIAVLKIASDGPFQVIELGNSDGLNVGDEAIAIGAPLRLPGTVTSGIISAINRSITVGASQGPGEEDGQFDFDLPGGTLTPGQTISIPVIQTDASINPGNSGGALLDRQGRLIGVNVAIASTGSQAAGSIGLGFAIPVNFAARVASELIATGRASHGLLGALVTDAQSVASSTVTGAYIDSVNPSGAAARGGIRAGDVVTRFNGIPITNRVDLTAQVRTLPGGSTSTITYVRGGNSFTVEVTLDELE